MYCSNCGTKIEDTVKFCPNCGKSTNQNQQNTVPKNTPYNNIPQTVIADKSSVGTLLVGLLVPVIITFWMWVSWRPTQPLKTKSLVTGIILREIPVCILIVAVVFYGIFTS